MLRLLHKHGHLDEANVLGTHVEALPAPHKASLPDESTRDPDSKTEAY